MKRSFARLALIASALALLLGGCQFLWDSPSPRPLFPTRTEEETEAPPETLSAAELERITSRTCYALGTNDLLEGALKVHVLFVDDAESSWTREKADTVMHHQIRPALAFLERQAREWGIGLTLSATMHITSPEKEVTLRYEGSVRNDGNGNCSRDVLDHASRDLGWSDKAYMYQQLFDENNYCEVIFLAVIDKPGRSYAVCQAGDPQVAMVESAVVFTDYPGADLSLTEDSHMALSVAHEILHLYGAEDLYEPRALQELARKHYPHDIMLIDSNDLEDQTLGALTAYSVGWTNRRPSLLGKAGGA